MTSRRQHGLPRLARAGGLPEPLEVPGQPVLPAAAGHALLLPARAPRRAVAPAAAPGAARSAFHVPDDDHHVGHQPYAGPLGLRCSGAPGPRRVRQPLEAAPGGRGLQREGRQGRCWPRRRPHHRHGCRAGLRSRAHERGGPAAQRAPHRGLFRCGGASCPPQQQLHLQRDSLEGPDGAAECGAPGGCGLDCVFLHAHPDARQGVF
mmetsp:Transcript_12454/g.33364  ORF Transcript_12454/g.33364 Transcript_12454/m.33364 type:complete len:206 (-) Transcript_12454:77-694(-)